MANGRLQQMMNVHFPKTKAESEFESEWLWKPAGFWICKKLSASDNIQIWIWTLSHPYQATGWCQRCFLQYFDTVGWVTGGHPAHKRSVPLIPMGRPAHVLRWLDHLAPCAVEHDVRCVPLVWGSVRAAAWVRRIRLHKSNYVKIIPMHMMIREIIPGRQQRVRWCPR